MRTRVLIAPILTVGVLLAMASQAGACWPGRSDRAPAAPVYLALGDSVAAGYGAPTPAEGYVGLLHGLLRTGLDCTPARASQAVDGCRHLGLTNLAVDGATTTTLISGQLPAAEALLAERNQDANPRNDVEVVTITVGGNDLKAAVEAIQQNCVQVQDPPTCAATVSTLLSAYTANLNLILAGIRESGGQDVTIVTTAYYNSLLPPCVFSPFAPLADAVLEGGTVPGVITLPSGLNDVTRQVSAQYGAQVADAFGQLGAGDLVGDCLHPDPSGHAILAGLFDTAITG